MKLNSRSHPIGPTHEANNVLVDKEYIARPFNQLIKIGESGSAKLRSGTQNGEIIEEFPFDSDRVFTSAKDLIIKPSNPLPYNTKVYLTMDVGFVVSAKTGEKCNFLTETSAKTFYFTTQPEPVVEKVVRKVGDQVFGGTIVSITAGGCLIISPEFTERTDVWDSSSNTISFTQENTSTKGWFIPTKEQLINPELIPFDCVNEISGQHTILWSSNGIGDSGYAVDVSTRRLILINKNNKRRLRTFKFIED